MGDGDVLKHGIVGNWRLAESPVHCRSPFKQPHHVDPHDRRGQEADGGERAKQATNAGGDRKRVGTAELPREVGTPARAAGDRHHQFGKPPHIAADGFEERCQKEPRRHRRLGGVASRVHHDHCPPVEQVVAPRPAVRRHQVEQPLRGVVVEPETLEREPWPPTPLAAGEFVVERMAAGFEHRPHAHDGPAATKHHHAVHRVTDPSRRPQHRIQRALRPLRAVVRQEPVGEVNEGRLEHLRPGGPEPAREALDGLPRDRAGRERGRGVIADRIRGELGADDAHGRLGGGHVWGGVTSV